MKQTLVGEFSMTEGTVKNENNYALAPLSTVAKLLGLASSVFPNTHIDVSNYGDTFKVSIYKMSHDEPTLDEADDPRR